MVDLLEFLLHDLGYALFECHADGKYRPYGKVPDWFGCLAAEPLHDFGVDLREIFPQVEFFQSEIDDYWRKATCGRLDLGIWEIDRCPTEPTEKINAFAARIRERNLVILQSLNRSHPDSLKHLQIAREREVAHSKQTALQNDRVAEMNRNRLVAEHLSEVKSMFVAKMSHEIRTPLTAIVSSLNLAMKTELNEMQLGLVTAAVDSANVISRLAGDLLELAKVEADSFELSIEPVTLGDLVNGVCSIYRTQAQQKGIDLLCEILESVPTVVYSDSVRLQQILANLISNAIKFTERGFVHVVVNVPDPACLSRVRFSVRDTGIGIPRDRVDSIFESFVQADSSIARRFGGTGLGLSIVKRLVELMGGTIEVRSDSKLGSEFSFETEFTKVVDDVQRRTEARTENPEATNHHPKANDRLRVLIADDHQINLSLVRQILCSAGFDVKAVEDGKNALRELTENRYDVAVLDWQMPGLNGTEVVRRIRNLERSSDSDFRLPIIALTAFVTDHDRQKCLRAGFDVFLGKPFDLDQLVGTVRRLGSNGLGIETGCDDRMASTAVNGRRR